MAGTPITTGDRPLICPQFKPWKPLVSICECGKHWRLHSPASVSTFFQRGDPAMIEPVLRAVKHDVDDPCGGYTPSRDWTQGKEGAPDCVCGRPIRAHLPMDVLKGIKAWRERNAPNLVSHCGMFDSNVKAPGRCNTCRGKWKDHPVDRRGLVIERFLHLHKPYCKCVTMNGDIDCNCMSTQEKQVALDSLVEQESGTKTMSSCKQFKSKTANNTFCGDCGVMFYSHTKEARNGFNVFTEWRAANMSNHDLLRWFMSLPGKRRSDKVESLKRFVADPYFKFTPPTNLVNPDEFSVKVLLDALTGSKHIQSPDDLKKDLGIVEAVVLKSEVVEEPSIKLYFCHWCSEMLAKTPGDACEGCAEYFRGQGTPVNSPMEDGKHAE